MARTAVTGSGDRVVKHRILFCASVAAFALLAAQPGLTQVVPPPYPGTMYPGDGALPPHEIVTIVRSTGLEPIGRPVRQGPAYALRAVDPAGEEVRVIVNAYMGRIVKVIPVSGPRYAMPLLRPPPKVASNESPTTGAPPLAGPYDYE